MNETAGSAAFAAASAGGSKVSANEIQNIRSRSVQRFSKKMFISWLAGMLRKNRARGRFIFLSEMKKKTNSPSDRQTERDFKGPFGSLMKSRRRRPWLITGNTPTDALQSDAGWYFIPPVYAERRARMNCADQRNVSWKKLEWMWGGRRAGSRVKTNALW